MVTTLPALPNIKRTSAAERGRVPSGGGRTALMAPGMRYDYRTGMPLPLGFDTRGVAPRSLLGRGRGHSGADMPVMAYDRSGRPLQYTYRSPSPTNVFVPSPDATGQIISFSRDPKRFALPKYVQYVTVSDLVGLYTQLDPKQSVRVPSIAGNRWSRGSVRPAHEHNLMPFQYLEYACERSDYGFTIPNEVGDSPSWPVKAAHARMLLAQAMTERTYEVYILVSTTANWPTGNTASANTLNGGRGQWDLASNDPASPNYLAIKYSIDNAALAILTGTNSIVTKDDLVIVMGPKLAWAISSTDEIRDYLKQRPDAMKEVEGKMGGKNSHYNLPATLYGLELVIEDSTIVQDNPGGPNDTQGMIWSGDQCMICSRAGGLDGQEGVPSFSTVQYFFFEQLTVETISDIRNRREEGHVVDDRVCKLAAGAAGYFITDCLASI